jgi:hypothetical protein
MEMGARRISSFKIIQNVKGILHYFLRSSYDYHKSKIIFIHFFSAIFSLCRLTPGIEPLISQSLLECFNHSAIAAGQCKECINFSKLSVKVLLTDPTLYILIRRL